MLGLAISHQLVGLMSVESEVGNGSHFTVCVQLALAPTVAPVPAQVPKVAAGTAMRILLAEDIVLNQEIAR